MFLIAALITLGAMPAIVGVTGAGVAVTAGLQRAVDIKEAHARGQQQDARDKEVERILRRSAELGETMNFVDDLTPCRVWPVPAKFQNAWGAEFFILMDGERVLFDNYMASKEDDDKLEKLLRFVRQQQPRRRARLGA